MGELEREGGLEAVEQQGPEWGGHPLFPRPETETGPDRRRFDIIHIQRFKADGSREVCPKAWKGSDLRSLEQIVEAYGGGSYQLTAQCSRTYRYQAHSERVQLPGTPRPFIERAEAALEPVPVAAPPPPPPPPPAAAAPQQAPPVGFVPGPAHYPFPPYAPPPSANNAETLAMFRAMFEASSANQTTLLRALLERPAGRDGSSPLEVVREIVPLMQGGSNGTQALLQGVELARGLIGPSGQAAPAPAAQPDEDFAMIGQVLRLIAPNHGAPPAAAPAPAPSAPPAATLAPPPGAPPPGWAWAFTAAGWALVQLGHVQPYPAPAPAPAAPPPSPAPAGVDVDAALAALLADPTRLERLRAVLGAPAAPPAPPVSQAPEPSAVERTTPPNPAPAPSAASSLAGGLEAALEDPELGRLFAGLSALTAGGAA